MVIDQNVKIAGVNMQAESSGVTMDKTRCGRCKHVSHHDTGIWWSLRTRDGLAAVRR